MLSDQILIEGLEVDASVGVYSHEKTILQRLVVDLSLACDVRKAGESDQLEDTLDYDQAVQIVKDVVTDRHHQLIECIAESIATRLLEGFRGSLNGVEVRIAKPGAVKDARTVAVVLRRSAGREP